MREVHANDTANYADANDAVNEVHAKDAVNGAVWFSTSGLNATARKETK